MSMLASSSNDLKFYQWPAGDLHQAYLPQNYKDGPIRSICWGKGGTWVVLVPQSGPAEIISVRENIKLLHTVEGVYNPTCAVFQNNTKKNIVFGTLAGQLLLYDVKAQTVQKRFSRANSEVFSVTSNANDSHFVAGCINGEVLLYNSVISNTSHRYKVPKSETATVVNFHRNVRSLLCAGSEEGIIVVWDVNTNAVRCNSVAHCAPVTDMTFSPIRSDLLVTCGLDRTFAFYDLLSNKCTLRVELGSPATSLDFSYCGVYLAMGSRNGNILLYDTRNLAKPVSEFRGHEGRKVCHVLFQKQPKPKENDSNSTVEFLLTEKPQHELSSEEATNSLGFVTCGDVNTQSTIEMSGKLSQEIVEDSFLSLMGLNKGTPSQTSLQQESCSSRLSVEVGTPAVGTKQMLSTPKYCIQTISPIVSVNDDASLKHLAPTSPFNLRPLDFTKIIRNAVKEELENYKKGSPTMSPSDITNVNVPLNASHCNLHTEDLKMIVRDTIKEEMENYKEEIRMEFLNTNLEMRQYFLDLLMYLVKKFVDFEVGT